MTELSRRDRVLGCLLGGAVGDALGARVEFLSIDEIRRRHGPAGVTDLEAPGLVTDDTQMTLFTLEGLIRAFLRNHTYGISNPTTHVRLSYLRWLHTQGEPQPPPESSKVKVNPLNGWLLDQPELHARRAPGRTCLAALRAGGEGTMADPINGSKGCGGVMRAAPVGLANLGDPFRVGCDIAALTHGHPSGYLTAGALALMVAELLASRSVAEALQAARRRLVQEKGHAEVLALLDRAEVAARREPVSAETVAVLGEGWVGEEALAMGVYCARVAPDFAAGVQLAVNHSGDSDSTGSITGNLLGAALGVQAIPPAWLEHVEGRHIIETLADDLRRVDELHGYAIGFPDSEEPVPPDIAGRYPGG